MITFVRQLLTIECFKHMIYLHGFIKFENRFNLNIQIIISLTTILLAPVELLHVVGSSNSYAF